MTPQEMLEKMKVNVEARTGRSFGAWVGVARSSGIGSHKALTDHMKQAHGLNHNEAQWAAWAVLDPGRLEAYDKPDDLVAELYTGKRAALRPTYDALLAAGLAVSGDVRPNVCKTYTSLAIRKQFAILNPRTLGGVDVELVLPDGVSHPRLEAFKGSNPQFKHRVRVSDPAQVDAELAGLLAAAAETAR